MGLRAKLGALSMVATAGCEPGVCETWWSFPELQLQETLEIDAGLNAIDGRNRIDEDVDLEVAVGSAGMLFTGPGPWQQHDVQVSNELLDVVVYYGDHADAWAVGREGTVLRGTEDGSQWTSVDLGTTVDLHGIGFALGERSQNNSFVIVGAGESFVTRDDGVSWSRIDLLAGRDLRAVSSRTGEVVVVGTRGTVLELDSALTRIVDRSLSTAATIVDVSHHIVYAQADKLSVVDESGIVRTWDPVDQSWTDHDLGFRVRRAYSYWALGDGGVAVLDDLGWHSYELGPQLQRDGYDVWGSLEVGHDFATVGEEHGEGVKTHLRGWSSLAFDSDDPDCGVVY